MRRAVTSWIVWGTVVLLSASALTWVAYYECPRRFPHFFVNNGPFLEQRVIALAQITAPSLVADGPAKWAYSNYGEAAVPILIRLLESRENVVPAWSLCILFQIDNESGIKYAKVNLNKGDIFLRQIAADILSEHAKE